MSKLYTGDYVLGLSILLPFLRFSIIYWSCSNGVIFVFFISSVKSGPFGDLIYTYFIKYIALKYNYTQYQQFKLILIVFVYCFYCSLLYHNTITSIKSDTFNNLKNLTLM